MQQTPQGQPYPPQAPYASGDVPGKGKAIGSLVCGIISLLIFWAGWGALIGIILAIVAIVLGVSARKQMPQGTAGMATGGLVCGVIGLILGVIGFIVCVALIGYAFSSPDVLNALSQAGY